MILSAHQTPSHPQFRRPSPQQQQQQQQQQQRSALAADVGGAGGGGPLLLRFKTDYQEKLQYLVRVGVVPTITPSRSTLDLILHLIDFLKSSGISDSHLPKLSSTCPQLFISGLLPEDISPVFNFLTSELGASLEDSAGLVLRCPHLLLSSVEHRLRPTLLFLRRISINVDKLTVPNHLNAHLLNTRVDKLLEKIDWLVQIGFQRDEAEAACARMRALFGYSIRNCMVPKYEYLVGEMGRPIDEVKDFPQYFGFSLANRIVPRHLHLKQRGVRVSLRDLLVCGDDKFYQRWN